MEEPMEVVETRLCELVKKREGVLRKELKEMMDQFRDEVQVELLAERGHRLAAEQSVIQLSKELRILGAQLSHGLGDTLTQARCSKKAQIFSGPEDTLAKVPTRLDFTEDALHTMMPTHQHLEFDEDGNPTHMTQMSPRASPREFQSVPNRSAYASLSMTASESLSDAKFDYKDLPEDMWGIAMMLLTRELRVMWVDCHDDIPFKKSNLIRFVYGLVCVLLNMFLQVAILRWVAIYIVGNSVWTLQGNYAQFHAEVFNTEGAFQQDIWTKWPGPRDEICQAVLTKQFFLGGILFLWIGRMSGEFKGCQRLIREIGLLPGPSPGEGISHCIIERGHEEAECEIIALTRCTRFAMYFFIILPKILICLLLAGMGVFWLVATMSFSDLILNALALEFIIGIDENILEFFLPARIVGRLGGTKFAYAAATHTEEQKEHDAIVDYSRNIFYFVVCLMLTSAIVMHQQVLPEYAFDIEKHCGAWYMNEFRPKCVPFETGCFPFGAASVVHNYGVLPPS